MTRLKIYKKIGSVPNSLHFKPVDLRQKFYDEVVLTIEEFESLRLKDLSNLRQKDAAKRMWVSQPTFNRIINSARRKISNAIINGKSIRVESKIRKRRPRERKS